MKEFSDSLAVLVHGFGCAPRHLSVWEKTLQQKFPNVLVPELPATHGTFEQCLRALDHALEQANAAQYAGLFLAGHSMGGLLLRALLEQQHFSNARRLVTVGSPHYGSPLADLALRIPFAGKVYPPLLAFRTRLPHRIITPEISGLAVGAIAGSANTLGWGRLFLSKDSDGRVLLTSARPPDAAECLTLPLNHNELMRSEDAARAILNFFVRGSFA